MRVSTRALAPIGGQFGRLQANAQHLIDEEYAPISGPDEARRAVRQAVYDGANVIKVIVDSGNTSLSLNDIKAIVDEAHRLNRPVAADASQEPAARVAADAGATSIEHGYALSEDVLKIMAAKRIFLVPTDLPDEDYFGGGLTAEERERRLAPTTPVGRMRAAARGRLARAVALGVPIAFGSDRYYAQAGGTRGQNSLRAFLAYAQAGLSTMQIIHAASVNGAELNRVTPLVGSLEAGKFADVIAIPGDPTNDVAALARGASFVMRGGVVIKR